MTEIWRCTAATRGTQHLLGYGRPLTAWRYSVYDEIVDKLVKHGLPREQIAAIGDADTDAKKQALFEKVRAGVVRVLIGSTQKMGTGTNVQKRLVALHHLDAPWKPAEVEQRDGRILRQGNTNEEVSIFRYVTEGSFDAYMWQALETKARFINQVMTGDSAVRQAEDIGSQELSYAEVKAIASGNPAVLTLAEADAELKRLTILKKHHADEQYLARRALRELPETRPAEAPPGRPRARHRHGTAHRRQPAHHRHPDMHQEGRARPAWRALQSLPTAVVEPHRFRLGTYRGLSFSAVMYPHSAPQVRRGRGHTVRRSLASELRTPGGAERGGAYRSGI